MKNKRFIVIKAKDLLFKNKLKLYHSDDELRQKYKVIEFNGILIRKVHRINVHAQDEGNFFVMITLHNKKDKEIARTTLHNEDDEIIVDKIFGVYTINKIK